MQSDSKNFRVDSRSRRRHWWICTVCKTQTRTARHTNSGASPRIVTHCRCGLTPIKEQITSLPLANCQSCFNFTDIQTTATRIKGVAHRTPILTSTTLNAMLGCEVFMKAENFQRMGAFKFRGGYNAINSLTDAERGRGVLAFSSGDQAQAVALAARLHGCMAARQRF